MSLRRISAIVAMSENRVIGVNNQLPWNMPADLAHFKTLTTGHTIIMGRKTFESIGKPLPNRTNIIVTRDERYLKEGCIVVNSIESALDQASKGEIFVIGGADIFKLTFPLLDRIYLTIIHHTFEGDVFFPEYEAANWQEVSHVRHPKDEKNLYDYSFIQLDKI